MPISKRKITVSNRTAFWPCGTGRRNCSVASIQCDVCNRWFNGECEDLSENDISLLSRDEQSYVCTPCFLEDVGPIYNFSSTLTRLYQAAHEGYRHLYIAIKKEKHVIPTLETCYPLKYDDWMTVDTYTNQLFLFSGMKDMGIPVRVTGNGNRFFNSLSMALCGSDSDYIWHLSPSYEEACISAATDKAWSSAWSFKSAANVLGITIRSVYSPINSKKCKAFQRLNCIFKLLDSPRESEISIAWTQCGGSFIPLNGKTWVPNHFVPVMERVFEQSVLDMISSKFQQKTFKKKITILLSNMVSRLI